MERRLAARLTAIEGERATILGEARAQARRELGELQEEIEALRAELAGHQSQSSLGERWLNEARARLAEAEARVVSPPEPEPLADLSLPGEVQVGDTVSVAGLGTTGQVTMLDGDSAEVQVGSFAVRVEQSSLERRKPADRVEAESPQAMSALHPSPGLELDLRGQRVDEMLPRLDKHLDDAFLAGQAFVRIIHGKGTGALRQAVRQQLRGHPLVKSQRPGADGEGGQGVTIAYLDLE
jgi:DNA mismatch repair protein MutS2